MFRGLVLGIAHNRTVRRIATGRAGRRVADRFVAGETLDDAVSAITRLNADGCTVSIDHLGENVADLERAEAAAAAAVSALDRIEIAGLQATVSVKLTQLGLDVDPVAAGEHAEAIVARAARAGTSVTLDMEDHRYTDRTIETCVRLAAAYPGAVGVAVQAYLRRTPEDLDRVIAAGGRIRLCKGAYLEPRAIALRSRREVGTAFARLITRLLSSPAYAMIATHDEAMIRHGQSEVRRLGRAPGTYEFQMLYGVRRELQRDLVGAGQPLRIYVPFGEQWYPYLTRRIAERPANIRFFLEALLRR